MEGYRFTVRLRARVSDLNYGGHVGNSRVLDYFQEARIAYLAAVGPFSELDIGGPGLILPEAHVNYRREMFLGDELVVGVRASEIGNSSLRLDYSIERAGEVTAEGYTALVAYDYQRRRVVRIPAGFKQSLKVFEGAGEG